MLQIISFILFDNDKKWENGKEKRKGKRNREKRKRVERKKEGENVQCLSIIVKLQERGRVLESSFRNF